MSQSLFRYFPLYSIKKRQKNLVTILPITIAHLGCFLVFWCGVSWTALIVFAVSYFVQMFGITAGYHRYFSHRSYKTSRVMQFLLAFAGALAGQLGPLWWSAHHRHHHRYSDLHQDVHSPRGGFWWSHTDWFFLMQNGETNYAAVRDLCKFPELRWLDRYYLFPPFMLSLTLFGFGEYLQRTQPQLGTSSLQLLVWGQFIATVAVAHATFCVNSITHLFGTRRFETPDDSRNNALVALFTFGEGWHNNHHAYPGSERQGIYWWEFDLSHYVLSALEKLGLVWELRQWPTGLANKKAA